MPYRGTDGAFDDGFDEALDGAHDCGPLMEHLKVDLMMDLIILLMVDLIVHLMMDLLVHLMVDLMMYLMVHLMESPVRANTEDFKFLNIFGPKKKAKNLTNRHADHKPGREMSVLNYVKFW